MTNNTITIEAADNGWILRKVGEPTRIFTRWRLLIRALEAELTNHEQLAEQINGPA